MNIRKTLFVLVPLISIVLIFFAESISAQVLQKRVIVTFRNIDQNVQDGVLSRFSVSRVKRLGFVNAQVIKTTQAKIESLRNDRNILRIEDDAQAFTLCHKWWHRCNNPTPTNTPTATPTAGPTLTPTQTPPQSLQPIPWGVDRIDADNIWVTTAADNIKVAVIDTGIDLDHSDLVSNIKGGKNTIYSFRNADDDNGHGTHVAGIIGARNNSIGVVGVGHEIDLYAVKALGKNGSGYVSDIIEGIGWSIDNNMDVINMSLGTTSDISAFHEAVILAKNAGIVVVAAAGNSGPSENTVIYPAKYPESIAVSAIDSIGNQPSWSSRGSEVDLAAPGDSIYSSYRGGGYRTLSGTSMAAPHVAGAAALVIATHPGMNPSQIQSYLESFAENLVGLSSNQQGAGLVDAENAVLSP